MKPLHIIFAVFIYVSGQNIAQAESTITPVNPPSKPQRIVSLNLCVDQLLLLLADPEQISAVTHLSHEKSASIYYDKALKYPATRALAEEVLPYKPDLVITGQYGNAGTTNLLTKLGLRLETLPIANSIDDVLSNIEHIATLTGYPERGTKITSAIRERLKDLAEPEQNAPKIAVYDPNGYTVGADSLRGQIIRAAGWQNIGELLGIGSYGVLSLEAVVRTAPDALFDSPYSTAYSRARALSRHPALRNSHIDPKVINIPSQMTICGGPWIMDVIEQLIQARKEHA